VILLVTQLELSSVRNTVRILHNMGEEGGNLNDKVLLILNRVGSDFWEGDLSLEQASETIGKPFYWKVPNDFKALVGSRAAGIPLIQYAPRSKAQQSIAKLARALCGKKETPEPATAGGGWWRRS
jgi:pilus assembly protein CpaE